MQPTDPSKFTDSAWDAIVNSQDVVRRFRQQQLEVEHLAIALLELQDSFANQLLSLLGADASRLEQQLTAYAKRQAKGPDGDQLYLGRSLDQLLDRAESIRHNSSAEAIDDEHLVLALSRDERIGRRLFRNAGIDLTHLDAAVEELRSQRQLKA
ncbi:MAG: Clp protease N-terminal domain-containing protein, partial [Elainellaceae cyanobacterium]